jgi:dipeptidase
MKTNKSLLLCILLFVNVTGFSCTTILVGKGLTSDASVMHAHNEDMGFNAVGRLWHVNAASHKLGATINVPYVTLKQPQHTHAYWASGNADATEGLDILAQSKPYDSILVGMNQWGVTMSCNWMNSREKNHKEKGIRRYAIRQLILERAKTAKQAVKIIGRFISEHGMADWGGLTFNLADTSEAWVVETTSNHWVAKRIADNEIWVVANRFTIGTEYDLSSSDLIDYAIKQNWYNPEKDSVFNFAQAYGNPEYMQQDYDIAREQRVKFLLKKKREIKAEDLFMVLTDRYDGTDKFTLPQKTENWREHSEENHIPRTIASNLGQSSSVAVLRPYMPVEVGAMMWYAMVSPSFSSYFPLYAGSTKVSPKMQTKNSTNNSDSAWWAFKNLQNKGNINYTQSFSSIQKSLMRDHDILLLQKKDLEKRTIELLKSGQTDQAISILNAFSYGQSEISLTRAHNFLEHMDQFEND